MKQQVKKVQIILIPTKTGVGVTAKFKNITKSSEVIHAIHALMVDLSEKSGASIDTIFDAVQQLNENATIDTTECIGKLSKEDIAAIVKQMADKA